MNDTTMTAPPKIKIAMRNLLIHQAEGLSVDCISTTHTTWKDAEDRIQRICAKVPKDSGYYKCDFRIHFVDGEEYEGRYDAAHPEASAYEGSLADHVRNHLLFYAGLKCPSHMKEADYERIVGEHTESKEKYLNFLKTYALEDLPMPTVTAAPVMKVITGNTYPAKGLLAMLGGKWDPNAKQWSVPAAKYAEAQAAVDRFNPPPKPVSPTGRADANQPALQQVPRPPTVNSQNVPRGTGTVVATNVLPTPPTVNGGQPITPRMLAAAKTVAKKGKKGPKLPPTSMERRLESLLAGTTHVLNDIPDKNGPAYGALANALAAIMRAIEATKG